MDDPFKNRPEDFLNKSLKAFVGALPVVGSPLSEFFHFVVVDPAQERRDDFVRQLLERLIHLESAYEQLKPANLSKNEQFIGTFLQATRAASATASAEKKHYLQNAVLNTAIGSVDESIRLKLLEILERFTPRHVHLLSRIQETGPKINSYYVEGLSAVEIELTHAFFTDLYGASLVRHLAPMSGEPERSNPGRDDGRTVLVSKLGTEFLKFIATPD